MEAPSKPLRVRVVVTEIPVTQTGIVQSGQIVLGAEDVRILGILTTNQITDSVLRTNIYFAGTANAGLAATESDIETLPLFLLQDGFSGFAVSSTELAANKKAYFAAPTRLGVPRFSDTSGNVINFTKVGEVQVVAEGYGVQDVFALWQSPNGMNTSLTRIQVRGLNTSGRSEVLTPSIPLD